jgi:hypothetical protein
VAIMSDGVSRRVFGARRGLRQWLSARWLRRLSAGEVRVPGASPDRAQLTPRRSLAEPRRARLRAISIGYQRHIAAKRRQPPAPGKPLGGWCARDSTVNQACLQAMSRTAAGAIRAGGVGRRLIDNGKDAGRDNTAR